MGVEFSGLAHQRDWRVAVIIAAIFIISAMLIAFLAFG